MVKLNFAHLCESAFILENHTPGIIGIFSKIRAASLPAERAVTAVVVNFRANDIQMHDLKISIKSPEGKEIASPINQKIKADNEDQDIGFIATVTNLTFDIIGEYKVEIIIDERIVETLSIHLSLFEKAI